MRILIDIGHPAHVHLFKHFAWEMQKNGHNILFTCRDKEFEKQLLTSYGFEYINFGKKYSSVLGKLIGIFIFDFKEVKAAIKFKPDILLSHGSIYAAHTSLFLGKPHISLEDTFNFEQIRLYLPFTKHVLTADYDHPLKTHKLIKYSGYHELAYLHPKRFSPDKSVLKELGVEEGEKYVIIRFVSWNASHDMGHRGISYDNKIKAVTEFKKYAKVFISSESQLPGTLEKYRIKIQPERMHDALAFATLIWGESFTIPAECSILGVPSIINHDTKSLYLKEQEEKYGLCFNFTESLNDQMKAIEKGIELLKRSDIKSEWIQKRNKLLSEKIDVTSFLVWFIENYPESAKFIIVNPEYQNNFK
ncbi:MAG: DUF354 domain-containing protein [Flavobacterium piscis]|nr:DUF354 domain-containing protein [Flavobacterium piscis]